MSETASDLAFDGLDGLLSPRNIARLYKVSDTLEHPNGRTLEDKLSSLAAANNDDLLDTALAVVSHLSSMGDAELNNSGLESIARIMCDRAILLEGGKGDFELVTEAAVASLSIICLRHSFTLSPQNLLKLTAVTDPEDPWTTAKAAKSASKLLADELVGQGLTEFIVSTVLQDFLKPLFLRLSSRITASGRPSQYVAVNDRLPSFTEKQPWKSQVTWVEATMQWALCMSTELLIQDHWPLFMPVLLGLVEHESIEVKTRGLNILALFVGKCPDRVLQNTGIGRVFADVTFPLLLSLPSVTPEVQSISILAPAYDVLIKLAESTGSSDNTGRRRLLDKILRDGILAGHFHASQHTRIIQILMQQTTAVVNSLGIYTTKHLTPLLSMISSIMTDPFAVSYPPTVIAATQALDAIIANAWPRIQEGGHMENIIRIISLCWLSVSEEIEHNVAEVSEHDIKDLSWQLKHTAEILEVLWVHNTSRRPTKLDEVLEQEPRLAKLFPLALA